MSAEMRACVACGVEAARDARTCPYCGATFDVTVTPGTGRLALKGHAPTPIEHGRDAKTGDEIIRVSAPGTTSESRLDGSGRMSVRVEGAAGVGRSGEGRVAKTLSQTLKARGHEVEVGAGRDDHGEDRMISVDESAFVMQAVTAPPASDFWREARVSSASTLVDIPAAAAWLREAISTKASRTPSDQRARTILTIDAQHSGLLASPSVRDAYVGLHGDPSEDGWASVWIVGPVGEYCVRLGSGTP